MPISGRTVDGILQLCPGVVLATLVALQLVLEVLQKMATVLAAQLLKS